MVYTDSKVAELFVSKASSIIFALTVMEGRQRMDFLRVNKLHYAKKTIAKGWYNDLKNTLMTDKTVSEIDRDRAIVILDGIYSNMID